MSEPLDVECPFFSCGAKPGNKCVVAHLQECAGGYWDWHIEYVRDKPHAARVRAALAKGEDR